MCVHMRVPNTPVPRTGPPPPRRRQHSRQCRTPYTPKASERAAGALRSGPGGPAHFLRMAFIGASSAAAAFFFLIALRIALRIAFAIAEGGGTRAAVCREFLFAG